MQACKPWEVGCDDASMSSGSLNVSSSATGVAMTGPSQVLSISLTSHLATTAAPTPSTTSTTSASTVSSIPSTTFVTSTIRDVPSMTATDTVLSSPTAPSTPSSSASSVPTDTPSTHQTTHILAITLPLALLIILAVFIFFFIRRRTPNARRTQDLERRADWFDPSYIARVREQMAAMDPNKVDPTHGPPAVGTTSTGITESHELPVWNYEREAQQQRRANDTNDDEIARWTNRGKMSGSLSGRVPEQSVAAQVQPGSRPLPTVPRTRTRTTATEEGSPVHVPYRAGANGSGSFDRRGDSTVDLSLSRSPWSPLEGSSGVVHGGQQQVYQQSQYQTINLDASNNASSSTIATNMDIPPPVFDPRGAIVRESQIGLALPFPPQEQQSIVHQEGQLTGDGYESLWQSRRHQGRGIDRARPRGGVFEVLPGLESGESYRAAAAAVGTDSPVDQRPPMEVSMAYPLLAGSERRGLSHEQRIEALRSRLDLLGSVRQRTDEDDEEDRRREEEERLRVAAGVRDQERQEQVRAAPHAADGNAVITRTEGGDEEIVKEMLKERFRWVRRLFGRR